MKKAATHLLFAAADAAADLNEIEHIKRQREKKTWPKILLFRINVYYMFLRFFSSLRWQFDYGKT